jgi:toxin ParE1/3/4
LKISIAAEAERELIEGARYYSRQASAELGLVFVAEFERATDVLRSQPGLGAKWQHDSRRMPLRRFPYSIIYLLQQNEIRILAVAHQRRKPGYWIGRK